MEQPEWGPRLVNVVAGQIRYHRERKRPKMSAQALADKCAELGWPIKRSVLSNLESGYRETITVPELFVLAQALEVPPTDLLLPLGRADKVEILPGMEVSTSDALDWLTGRKALPGTEWESSATGLFQTHKMLYDRWHAARVAARELLQRGGEDAEQEVAYHEEVARGMQAALWRTRTTMRERGLTPPDLPPELAAIEEVRQA
jgi:transcriptional regulator with XRE-family HTH domain